jgi:quercetin dioxygenase-like cupin family protein
MSSLQLQPARVIGAGEGRRLNVIGHVAVDKIRSADTAAGTYTFELTSPPGAGVPPHVHEHEDEMIYVVQGELEVTTGETTTRAGAGAVLDFARGTPHALANVGDVDAVTLWAVSPGAGFEAFFDELAALPAGPPDPAVLVPVFARYGLTILGG